METLVKANADELNQSLIDFIQKNFKGKNISVHISEDLDETDYLLSDPIHKAKLLKSLEEVNDKQRLKAYSLDEIKTMFLNEP